MMLSNCSSHSQHSSIQWKLPAPKGTETEFAYPLSIAVIVSASPSVINKGFEVLILFILNNKGEVSAPF